jgi:hydrogenase/urease accessory protein HupE
MRVALITAALLLVPAGASLAHVRSTQGYSEIRAGGGSVAYELSLETAVLDAAAGEGSPAAYVLPRVQVFLDGVECEGSVLGTGAASRDGRDHTRLRLGYECPGSPGGAYEVRYGVFADGGVVDDHANVARYDLGDDAGTFVFDAGHRELEAGSASLAATASRFATLGIEHILLGIDHLLFVLGLVLIVQSAKLLVQTITAFTIAHSITLAVATLGFVHVPGAPVEAVIALSILFLASELTRQRRGESGLTARYPWLVAFSFGLLHGFGFAGALAEVGLPERDITLALLVFNLGVEAGQLLFVAGVLALLWLGRRVIVSPPPRWLQDAPAYAIGSLAAFWLIQRVAAFG